MKMKFKIFNFNYNFDVKKGVIFVKPGRKLKKRKVDDASKNTLHKRQRKNS